MVLDLTLELCSHEGMIGIRFIRQNNDLFRALFKFELAGMSDWKKKSIVLFLLIGKTPFAKVNIWFDRLIQYKKKKEKNFFL